MLGNWGNSATQQRLTHQDLAENRWRTSAKRLFEDLTKARKLDFGAVKELIVIPDGELWQLPFEVFFAPDVAAPTRADRIEVRYSPAAGLAVGDARRHRSGVSMVVPATAASREHRERESEHVSALHGQADPSVSPPFFWAGLLMADTGSPPLDE